MPDRSIAVREGEATLHQLPIDLIKEAEFDRIGGIAPDSKVAATFGESGSKCPGVSWMHDGSVPCAKAYPSVTSRS